MESWAKKFELRQTRKFPHIGSMPSGYKLQLGFPREELVNISRLYLKYLWLTTLFQAQTTTKNFDIHN